MSVDAAPQTKVNSAGLQGLPMRSLSALIVLVLLPVPGWSQANKLLASDGAIGDFFGASVAVLGTLGVVGARNDYDNGSQSGSAYLFNLASGVQYAKLLASDGEPSDVFGTSVGIGSSFVVVGAPTSSSTKEGKSSKGPT